MKDLVIIILTLTILFLVSCGKKELEEENEYLRKALLVSESSSEILSSNLEEVNRLLDSIDVAQKTINIDLETGLAYKSYVSKIQAINDYIKDADKQLDKIENQLSKTKSQNKVYLGMIKKLRNDLSKRENLITTLQEQVEKYKSENKSLIKTVDLQRKEIVDQKINIQAKKEKLLELNQDLNTLNQQIKGNKAEYYFQQGLTNEVLANKTKLAPRKKKAYYKKAYDFYKKAFDLNRTDAYDKMKALENKIN